jgi:hypothetical protein
LSRKPFSFFDPFVFAAAELARFDETWGAVLKSIFGYSTTGVLSLPNLNFDLA